jgi:hypothetical protein
MSNKDGNNCKVKEIFHIYLKLFNGEVNMSAQMIELEEVIISDLNDEALEGEVFEGGQLSCWSGSDC